MMEKLLGKVKELFEKFKSQSKKIKIAVIASVIAVIVAIVSAVVYSTSNKYAILFSASYTQKETFVYIFVSGFRSISFQ